MFSAKDLFFTPASIADYLVNNSLRFRASASAYLSRTPASASNRTVWTWSGWVKRGTLGAYQSLFNSYVSTNDTSVIDFSNTDTIRIQNLVGGVFKTDKQTTAVYRDPSAWYHIVVASNGATSLKLYVNGVEVTNWGTNTGPDASNWQFNSTNPQWIGREQYSTTNYYTDGYLAEINFIDGQALDSTYFGKSDVTTGVWVAKQYTGSYGTNGFYLKFADTSGATATTIGKDSSGNGNNWTPNNISVTSGTTYDAMIDAPNIYALSATQGVGNYGTLNPVAKTYALGTKSSGNLDFVGDNSSYCQGLGTLAVPTSGKWYWEVTATIGVGGAERRFAGIWSTKNFDFASNVPQESLQGAVHYYALNGSLASNSAFPFPAYGAAWTTGDIIGVAVNVDTGQITFYKNNTSQGTATLPSNMQNVTLYPSVISLYAASGLSINFGQRPFTYTPPSGYSALNTSNLTTPTITNGAQYMAAVLYNGTSSSNTVTTTSSNSGNNPLGKTFQPDLVWIKSRSAATNHKLTDAVRGTTKALISNTTGAETTDTNGLTAFTSSGFTVGSDSTYNNGTGPATYAAWEWLAGAGTTSVPTGGNIPVTSASVNASAGFSILKYTGNGSTNQSVPHGLGVAPGMVIVKNLSNAASWCVHHQSQPTGYTVYLNLINAEDSGSGQWGSSVFTSSLFYVGYTSGATGTNNNSDNYVAYCFAPVTGYSAFGSYTGNGSADGPFIYTGFRPRWVMIKATNTAAENWYILDTSRDAYNASGLYLFPSASSAETNYISTYPVDFLSNGFKIRNNAYPNTSAITYIYAAFAENPFKYSNAR